MSQKYALRLGSAMTLLMLSPVAAVAAVGHKSPKECNNELYSRLVAIKSAGMTPAQFIHDCWWHSQPGQPTPLAHNNAVKAKPTVQAATPLAPAVNAGKTVEGSLVASKPEMERSRRSMRRPTRTASLAQAVKRRSRQIAMRHANVRKVVTREALRRRLLRTKLAKQELLRRFFRRDAFANEALRRRPLRERLAMDALRGRSGRRDRIAAGTQRARNEPRPSSPVERDDLRIAMASQGPSAREGRRMWVQVVTAGNKAQAKDAVFLGALPEGAERTSALNCWGQPVLFVGRDTTHWSRSMVCDGKPAGANEWSAQIYYGGADPRTAR